MGISNNPKGRSLLHPEPFGRGASGHSVLEKQHLSNKMIVFQDALISFPMKIDFVIPAKAGIQYLILLSSGFPLPRE